MVQGGVYPVAIQWGRMMVRTVLFEYLATEFSIGIRIDGLLAFRQVHESWPVQDDVR